MTMTDQWIGIACAPVEMREAALRQLYTLKEEAERESGMTIITEEPHYDGERQMWTLGGVARTKEHDYA